MGSVSYGFVLWVLVGLASPPTAQIGGPVGDALVRLESIQPTARVRRAGDDGPASLITGLAYVAQGESPRAKAEDFLRRFSQLTGGDALRFRETSRSRGQVVVHFDQQIAGDLVLDRSATVTMSHAGVIRTFNSDYAVVVERQRSQIDEARAVQLAMRHLSDTLRSQLPTIGKPTVKRGVVVFAGVATDVYEVHTSRAPMAEHLIIRVDAHAGSVLSVSDAVIH